MQGQAAQNRSDRARNIVRGIGAMSVQTVVSALLGFVLLGSLLPARLRWVLRLL